MAQGTAKPIASGPPLDNTNPTSIAGAAVPGTSTSASRRDHVHNTPLTTLGDVLYRGGSDLARLAGNTTALRQFLTSLGASGVAQAPFWDVLGLADLPIVPMCALRRDTAFSVPNNSTTDIKYDTGNATELFDSNGMHDMTLAESHKITIQTAGVYFAITQAQFAQTSTTGIRQLYCLHNVDSGMNFQFLGTALPTGVAFAFANAAVGSYFYTRAFQNINSGGALTIVANGATFLVFRIGRAS